MLSLLAGTVFLAAVHALIPNHWLPLVAVARAEGWKRKELTSVTLLAAAAHVTGTVILGLVLGKIGKELQEEFGRTIVIASSILLIVFGLIYFTVNLPHHHHSGQQDVTAYKRSKRKWVLIFIGMMFLSPCLEVERGLCNMLLNVLLSRKIGWVTKQARCATIMRQQNQQKIIWNCAFA